MRLLRNRAVARTLMLLALLFACCAVLCFSWNTAAGIAVTLCGVLTGLIYWADSVRRYRKIQRLSSEIDRLLHGTDLPDFSLYEEGELEILYSELRKLVVRLREQTDLLQKDKLMLADSMADISHQLRTPLTAVNLNLASLEKSLTDVAQAELFADTKRQVYRIDRLISSLLKLARLDAGAVQLKTEPTALSDVVRAAAAPLAIVMDVKGQELCLDVSGTFTGDRDWTVEAVGNLLKNCTEHMESGTITVTGSENPLYAELIVRDTGTGFDREDIPHLFERFYRGKNASTDSVGIGLALARQIVQMQNGTIKAANHPSGGAVFTVRFYRSIL